MLRILFAIAALAVAPASSAQNLTQWQLGPGNPSPLQLRDLGKEWNILGLLDSTLHQMTLTPFAIAAGGSVSAPLGYFGPTPFLAAPAGGQFTPSYLQNISIFGSYSKTATGTAGTAISASVIQDGAGGYNYPTAVLGYAAQNFPGYGVYSGNFVCDLFQTGICSNEIDANNWAGATDGVYPPDYANPLKTYPQGLYLGCGGTFDCYAGLMLGPNGFHPSAWDVGVYAPPGGIKKYGVFIDASPTLSPQYSIYARNNGQGSNIPFLVQITGPAAPSNPVFGAIDSSGNNIWRTTQAGAVVQRGPTLAGDGGGSPSFSACGTSPSFAATSYGSMGVFTVGLAPVSNICVINFPISYFTNQPFCVGGQVNGTALAFTVSYNTSNIVFDNVVPGAIYTYICMGS